jgi:hypothetical protein
VTKIKNIFSHGPFENSEAGRAAARDFSENVLDATTKYYKNIGVSIPAECARYVSLHVQNLAGYHITVRLSFAKKMGIIFSYLHTSIAAFTKSWQLHVASPTTFLTATEVSSVTLLVPVNEVQSYADRLR